eukprot:jgi/Tetstr1/434921/TSEL_023918.t1
MAAALLPERPTARPDPGTTPPPGRHSCRRFGGLLDLLGRGLRATALVDVVAGVACVAARFLTALVLLCLMMPPALFCCGASTPTKPWSFGDATVPASGMQRHDFVALNTRYDQLTAKRRDWAGV